MEIKAGDREGYQGDDMIKTFEYIAPNGAKMSLLHNDYFNVIDITGLTVINNDVAAVVVPQMDGDVVNNVQAQPRDVTIYLRLKQSAGVQRAQRYVMQYVKPKLTGTLHMVRDDLDIKLEGIVTAVDLPRFTQGCTMAITLYCSMPYWEDVSAVQAELSTIINLHHFPISFPAEGVPFGEYDNDLSQHLNNTGDVATGMIITLIATGEVVNPKLTATDGQFIGITDTLQVNDEVIINTVKGKKSITKNGTDILNKIAEGSHFLQLQTGDNKFTISADEGVNNMYFTLEYKRLYI